MTGRPMSCLLEGLAHGPVCAARLHKWLLGVGFWCLKFHTSFGIQNLGVVVRLSTRSSPDTCLFACLQGRRVATGSDGTSTSSSSKEGLAAAGRSISRM